MVFLKIRLGIQRHSRFAYAISVAGSIEVGAPRTHNRLTKRGNARSGFQKRRFRKSPLYFRRRAVVIWLDVIPSFLQFITGSFTIVLSKISWCSNEKGSAR